MTSRVCLQLQFNHKKDPPQFTSCTFIKARTQLQTSFNPVNRDLEALMFYQLCGF